MRRCDDHLNLPNTSRSSIPSGWWRRVSSLRWAASATVMTMLSPRRSTVSTRPRSSIGAGHGGHYKPSSSRPGMGGLVQQPAALGAHRQHPAGRSRGTLLRHAGTTGHGGMTQTKWPPTNPGRFIELTGRPAKHLVSETVSAERGFVGYGCYWPMLTESKARVIMSYCDQTPGRAPTCATQSIPVRGRES